MFDRSKPNIILISDYTDNNFMIKSIATFKLARELRLAGYQVAVLYHLHIFKFEEILHILENLISDQTVFVGFNNMFYKNCEEIEQTSGSTKLAKFKSNEPGCMLPHGKAYNQKLKSHIKNLNPSTKLVFGGPTAFDAATFKEFDYVILGYADTSIVSLANYLSKQQKLDKSYKSIHGFVIVNDAKAQDFDFVNSKMEYEVYDCVLPSETLSIEISCGCIFSCAFCAYPLNGKRKFDYIKNPDLLLAEFLDNYEKFNVTRYFFLDDTFNDSKEKIELIYDISRKLPFKLEYWAFIRLDLLAARPETIDMLYQSGMRHCFFGIESFNKETGEIIGKGMAREKLIGTLQHIKNTYGDEITVAGSFILGLPKESIESMKQTCEFLLQTDLFSKYYINPYVIKTGKKDSIFNSKIESDPQKYGYKNIQPLPTNHNNEDLYNGNVRDGRICYWENDQTNWHEVEALSEYYGNLYNQNNKTRMAEQDYMMLAGLGLCEKVLARYKNKLITDINWNVISLIKNKRATEYKNMFYKMFNLSKINT
jgi:hypothetical protein